MIYKIFNLLSTSGALTALFRWKKFSLASFKVATRLKQLGVFPITIIDIGANEGQFSTAASHILRPKNLIVVEANPILESDLHKNLSHVDNKQILMTGVGNFDGELPFNFNADSQVSSFLNLGRDRLKAFPESVTLETSNVSITKLDSLIDKISTGEPILLKIDVQGLEREVIQGAESLLKRVEWVLIETSFAKLYNGEATFTEMLDIMRTHGFVFIGSVDFHEDPLRTKIIEMDALFARSIN